MWSSERRVCVFLDGRNTGVFTYWWGDVALGKCRGSGGLVMGWAGLSGQEDSRGTSLQRRKGPGADQGSSGAGLSSHCCCVLRQSS